MLRTGTETMDVEEEEEMLSVASEASTVGENELPPIAERKTFLVSILLFVNMYMYVLH